jgi:RNA polymerase sigma factor (sigma-70 family)
VQTKTDGQLLREFVAGSQPAFEELTGRHARTVFGICQRLMNGATGDDETAQAVFLALARKARSLSDRPSVSGWLHHTACLIAGRARAASNPQAAHADGEWTRMKKIVDTEIDELSEKYRVALILQNIEDLNQEEAARQAGCSSSLIAARLERARERLRDRFATRGVVLSVGILAIQLARHGRAEMIPDGFISATAKAACLTLERKPAASDRVAAMMNAALRQMFFARLRVAAAIVVTGCIVGAFAADLFATSKPAVAVAASSSNSDGWVAPSPPPLVILEPAPSPAPGPVVANPVVTPAPVTVLTEKPAELPVAAMPVVRVSTTVEPKIEEKPRAIKPGLSLSIQTLKQIYGAGETPVFSFVYKNTGEKMIALNGGGQSNIRISIEKSDGEKSSWRFDGNKLFAARPLDTILLPAQSCTQKEPLFGRFIGASADPIRPLESLPAGKYRMTVRVSFSTPHQSAAGTPEFWDGDVEASGEFEVGEDRAVSLNR